MIGDTDNCVTCATDQHHISFEPSPRGDREFDQLQEADDVANGRCISTEERTSQRRQLLFTLDTDCSRECLPKKHPTTKMQVKSKYLNGGPLWRAVLSLNVSNIAAFTDIVGIAFVLEEVMDHYYDSSIISWSPTAQLIGATVGQCILGYLSDIFPRRNMLLFSVVLLFFTSIGCALCVYTSSAAIFVVIRCFSGIAFGSTTNLVNVAQNDILPERRRLNFQGMQGGSVAIGSIIGAVGGAALASHPIKKWQYLYYVEAGIAAVGAIMVLSFLPPHKASPTRKQLGDRLMTIDFLGILSGIGCIVPGLLLLCRYDKLTTTIMGVLAALTAVSGAIFLYFGFTQPFDIRRYISGQSSLQQVRPIIPFSLFRNPMIAALLLQNIFFGAAFYTFIYFTPFQLQILRDIKAILAAVTMVPYFVTHGIVSAASAQLVVHLKNKGRRSYSVVMALGFTIWTIAMALLGWEALAQVPYLVLTFGIFVGLGTGSVFQNSVVALSSAVDSETKAVAVGTRNVLRFFGGALGTAISYAVVTANMRAKLPPHLQYLAGGNLSTATEHLDPDQKEAVQDAASVALAWVFYASSMMLSVCLLLCWFVTDNGRKKGSTVGQMSNSDDANDERKKQDWELGVQSKLPSRRPSQSGVNTPFEDRSGMNSPVEDRSGVNTPLPEAEWGSDAMRGRWNPV